MSARESEKEKVICPKASKCHISLLHLAIESVMERAESQHVWPRQISSAVDVKRRFLGYLPGDCLNDKRSTVSPNPESIKCLDEMLDQIWWPWACFQLIISQHQHSHYMSSISQDTQKFKNVIITCPFFFILHGALFKLKLDKNTRAVL